MAGKIVADTIEGTTTTETVGGASVTIPNSIDTKYVVNGSAKAWHRGSSDGETLHDSLNVSTLVDSNTGVQVVNLTASMNNANYEASNCIMQNSTLTTRVFNLATGSYTSGIRTTAGSLNDAEQSSSIRGDLA